MDTIVALATASGRSAIGVIRLSGPEALQIARGLTGGTSFTPQPGKVTLRSIKPVGQTLVLDQALLTYFEAPNSYTGEDVLEISCHGSPVILRQVIDVILNLGGRLAGPGEFTLRALSNGKLNLSQAEAVRDLINARTDAAAQQALRQLKGELSARLQASKDRLLQIIVLLESALEFVEDDLPAIEKAHLRASFKELIDDVSNLTATFETGHLLRDGLKVTIVGRPNVGKSSLFNKLLALDRAIVTDLPGTTRDTLTEPISLKGVPVLLTDTAGVRESTDRIERIGVQRTEQAIADADLLVVMLDGSSELCAEDFHLLAQVRDKRHIVARNKSDVPSFRRRADTEWSSNSNSIDVSAVTGCGLEELRTAILAVFGLIESADAGLLITDARHHDLLRRALIEFQSSLLLLDQGASEELILVGLYNGLRFLGEITGETTTEEILSEIFATFCIGK